MNISNAKEIVACHNDFEYFCQNYILLPSSTKGPECLSLNEYQKNLIKDYDEHRHIMLVKYRNGRFATTTMAWLLWNLLFRFDQRIIWVEPREIDAKYAAKRFKLMIDLLPEWLYPTLNNKRSIYHLKFTETGGDISFRSPQSCRGMGCSHVVINDAAFIKNLKETWTAIWPILSCGGQSIIMSTAADYSHAFGWFEQTYRDSQNKKMHFIFTKPITKTARITKMKNSAR